MNTYPLRFVVLLKTLPDTINGSKMLSSPNMAKNIENTDIPPFMEDTSVNDRIQKASIAIPNAAIPAPVTHTTKPTFIISEGISKQAINNLGMNTDPKPYSNPRVAGIKSSVFCVFILSSF